MLATCQFLPGVDLHAVRCVRVRRWLGRPEDKLLTIPEANAMLIKNRYVGRFPEIKRVVTGTCDLELSDDIVPETGDVGDLLTQMTEVREEWHGDARQLFIDPQTVRVPFREGHADPGSVAPRFHVYGVAQVPRPCGAKGTVDLGIKGTLFPSSVDWVEGTCEYSVEPQ